MSRAKPLRFLALVLGLWVGARAIILAFPGAPDRPQAPANIAAAAPVPPPAASRFPQSPAPAAALDLPSSCCSTGGFSYQPAIPRPVTLRTFGPAASFFEPAPDGARVSASEMGASRTPSAAEFGAAFPAEASPGPLASLPSPGPRWSGSAWLLVRDGQGQAALAPGGTLGGSQAGGRLLYRVGERLALSGRVYAPLRRPAGAELAAGIDWRPSARLPVHLLAERRQDVGGEGRSAFALTLYGGTGGRLPGGLRGEAYAQAGVVGTRSRDLFVDASARVSVPAGRIEVGGSAWAAAQPGTARLDAGPHLSYRLPVKGATVRLQADWRFRIAGDAAPGSGPALTIATNF